MAIRLILSSVRTVSNRIVSNRIRMLVLAVDVMYARATHIKGLDEVGGK